MPQPHALLSTLATVLVGSGLLVGQTPPKPASVEEELLELLNTPISGASKREQRLIDSPQAIEVLTGADLRQQGIYRLQDALQLLTSVDILEADNGFSVLGMRGIMQEGQPRTVQVLVDGVPMYSALGGPIDISNLPLPIELVERIEVVRGPSSTLYGANAVAGVIAITTRTAEAGTHASLRASLADKRTARGGAALSHAQDRWAFSAGYTGYSMGASGFETHYLGSPGARRWYKDEPTSPSNTANPFIGSDAGHGMQAMARGAYHHGETRAWLQVGQSDKWYGPEGYFAYRKTGRSLALAGWRQGWTPQLTTELRIHRVNQTNRLSKSDFLAVAFEDPGFRTEYKWADQTTTQVELQANWDPSDTLHFVFGADSRRIVSGNTPFIGLAGGAKETASGGFASMDWSMAKTVALSVGFRMENESLGGSRTSPRVALVWNPTPQSALRAGWFTSTRSPQVLESRVDLSLFAGAFYPNNNPAPPNIPVYARLLPNPDLKPEKTANLELGYRHAVGSVTFDLTLYRMTFQELITQTPLAPVVQPGATTPPFSPVTYSARLNVPNQFRNAGDATNQGLELAITWAIQPGWTLGMNATNLSFQRDQPTIDVQGLDFAYAVRHRGSTWLRVNQGRFTGFFAVQYVGNTLAEALQARGNPYFEPREAFWQSHLNLAWALTPALQVGAYARNASQEFTLQGATGPDRQTPFQAARRELGLTVGYRF